MGRIILFHIPTEVNWPFGDFEQKTCYPSSVSAGQHRDHPAAHFSIRSVGSSGGRMNRENVCNQ
jgi:hypothetical protein